MEKGYNENTTASLGGGGANNATSLPGALELGGPGSRTTNSKKSKIDMTLSEEEEYLRSTPERDKRGTLSKNSKSNREAQADLAAIKNYKSKLRKARFFIDKTMTTMQLHTPLNIHEDRNWKWALEVTAKEKDREDRNISLSSFVRSTICETSNKRNRSKDEGSEPPSKRTDQTVKASTPVSRRMEEAGTSASKGIPPPKSSSSSSKGNRVIPPAHVQNAKHRKNANPRVNVINIDGLAYNEIVKQNLKVSIIDANAHDLKMSVEHFSKVEGGIQKIMFKMLLDKKIQHFPAFKMNERYRGFRIITCETSEALSFLKNAVGELEELWTGAKLEVRHLHELPTSPLIKTNLPMMNMDIKMVMGLLSMNNKDLPVDKWKLVGFGRNQGGRIPVVFRVDGNSVKTLEKNNMEMGFCLRSVVVKVLATNLQEEMNAKEVSVEEVKEDPICDISSLFVDGMDLAEEDEIQPMQVESEIEG